MQSNGDSKSAAPQPTLPGADILLPGSSANRTLSPPAAVSLTQTPPPNHGGLENARIAPAVLDVGVDALTLLAPPQAPGELGFLGPYLVLKVLGSGGMGIVFQARDSNLERVVALKVLKPELANCATARQRFLREARAAAQVKHDHVVCIYQVGEEAGAPYLAMEFLEGESLDHRVKRETKLPVEEVLRIGREIADGLGAAHARGLIHRDIKPGNIWLEGGRGRVKILDFGLARAATEANDLTQSGAIVGTPAYMAPEQARSMPLDARCDLFSLGCVLYRCATGKLPFRGSDPFTMLLALTTDEPRPPQELNPELPAELAELIIRLLAKSPERRPESAAIVAAALRGIEMDLTTSVPAEAAPAKPQRRRQRRGPVVGVGLLFVCCVILAGAALWLPARNGTVIVSVGEPHVKVQIDGKEEFDIDSSRVGQAEVPAGDHEMVIRRGNVAVYTTTFHLIGGESKHIEATWPADGDEAGTKRKGGLGAPQAGRGRRPEVGGLRPHAP